VPTRVTLTNKDLTIIAAVLVGGALLTASSLRFIVQVPVPLVMLLTCLSPAALILLLYMGYLLRAHPEKRGYLIVLRILGLASVCIGLLVFLDFALPTRTAHEYIRAKVLRGDQHVLQLGGREQEVDQWFYKDLVEGDELLVETTRVFERLETITAAAGRQAYAPRTNLDRLEMIAVGMLFLLPALVFRFTPRPEDNFYNMTFFALVIAPSYIISLVAVGLLAKLLLVNVFKLIG
jgi:hypothetical protein